MLPKILRIFLPLIGLFASASASFALPNCPSDQTKRYHNCFGTITLQNGSKYIGDFRDAKRHGTGTQIYSTGAIYKGEWENGKRNGYGSFKLKTALTNISQAGLWKDGVFQD